MVSADAATLIVTTTADSGAGSLRQAVLDAHDGDTVQFDPALNGQAISLTQDEIGIDQNMTISGPGPTMLAVSRTPKAPFFFRIFHIMPGRTALIQGLTINGGEGGDGRAGAILNESASATLEISNCIVRNNVAVRGNGGGIYNEGTLTITNSIIRDNLATVDLFFNFGSGGGIFNLGTLTITNSTISGNATFHGSPSMIGSGGGIVSGGPLTIINSTISGNNANAYGGGIVSGGSMTIINSTISGNFVEGEGGGISNGGSLTFRNCTMSDNQAQNGAGGGIYNTGSNAAVEIGNTILKASASGANILNNSGTITSLGYNLSSDEGGGFLTATGDQVNTNPMLGPLQDNGGATFTHDLLAGSPAINAGDPNFVPPPVYDQRGYARVFGGRIDIGSVELQPAPTPTPTPTSTATPSPTATSSPIPARALNISTRLRVELGDNVMIGGFIITPSTSPSTGSGLSSGPSGPSTSSGPGGEPKRVVVRGLGPSLASSGVSDALADPTLELRDASGLLLFQNDNWQDDSAQAAQLTVLGLAPADPNESGIVATLQPGAYTAVLAGMNSGTGVGLVEAYDADSAATSELANISTRGFVRTDDNVMIGGFILGGSSVSASVIVRGIGPSLSQSGLSHVLADPTLQLRDSNGMLLIANDNWQDDSVSAAQLMAHGLAPKNSLESGIFASLLPGTFTAILAGKNGGVGLGLVEIYDVR